MSEHWKKAVEAAADRLAGSGSEIDDTFRGYANDALQAAEPHLQRMCWERFSEAVLSADAIEAVRTNRDREDEEHRGESRVVYVRGQNLGADFRAALNKAQELMEGDGDA